MTTAFNDEEFIKYRDFIQHNFGIFYADIKKDILKIKIDKCLLKSGVNSYDDYFKIISEGENSSFINSFINEITVNKTEFFREQDQLNFLIENSENIFKSIPNIKQNSEIKVWSMACSTGQEPYSVAMVLNEIFPFLNIKILATDLSSKVLKTASSGKYPVEFKKEIDPLYLNKYFNRFEDYLEVKPFIRDMVTFRHFNLINPFPFNENFDMIFCKNVMIYFDMETQKDIISKIHNCLSPGGLLFLGLSESLLNKSNLLKSLKYSIYINKQ